MTRVISNKMELYFNSAVFGSFTLYSAGVVNFSIARVYLVVFLILTGPGLLRYGFSINLFNKHFNKLLI